MSQTLSKPPIHQQIPPLVTLALFLLALLAIRVIALYYSQINLFFDEAQYWIWSTDLAFGYFSKPPMLAWSIRAATDACGLSEFCIRLPSPIMHAVAALFIFLSARALFGAATALWAAVIYATLPGLSYSSGLISTDVPLLLFWTMALFFFIKLLETRSWIWAFALGAAFGLGLMSKYAMAYFILCAVLCALVNKDYRWILTSPQSLLVLAIGAMLVAPNMAWNFSNGFVTFSHTAANAKWQGSLLHPEKALEFFAAQFGVFGPILFAAFLIIAWRFCKNELDRKARLLIAFSLPIIAIVTLQAFISRAHANWAATAYPAAAMLVTVTMLQDKAIGWFRGSLALHLAIVPLLAFALANPRLIDLPFGIDPFKRVLGWPAIATATQEKLAEGQFGTVLTDHRALTSELLYYGRNIKTPLKAWRAGSVPHDHFQLTRPFKGGHSPEPALLITFQKTPEGITRHFSQASYLGEFQARSSTTSRRNVYFFSLSGYRAAANAP